MEATEGKTFVDFVAGKIRLIPEIARTVATLPERLDRIEKMLTELQKQNSCRGWWGTGGPNLAVRLVGPASGGRFR